MNIKSYKGQFIEFINVVKTNFTARELDEQTVPSYTHPVAIVRYIFWDRIVTSIKRAKSRPFGKVLDFGSGTGILLPLLSSSKNSSSKLYAYDIDENSKNIIQKTVKHFDLKNVEVIESVDSIEKGSLDLITALDVLEHIEDLDSIAKKFDSLLAKDGRIIISCPTESLLYRSMRMFGGEAYHGHTHFCNVYDVDKVFKKYFKAKVIKTLYFPLIFFKIIEYTKE
jgi:2-polyprenyl-3-methyl-5-hydroxy-6-metoxy-1,4-benzoquinol methylase